MFKNICRVYKHTHIHTHMQRVYTHAYMHTVSATLSQPSFLLVDFAVFYSLMINTGHRDDLGTFRGPHVLSESLKTSKYVQLIFGTLCMLLGSNYTKMGEPWHGIYSSH